MQTHLLMSQRPQSISALSNSTCTHQQWVAPGLEVKKTLDSSQQQGWEWSMKLALGRAAGCQCQEDDGAAQLLQ